LKVKRKGEEFNREVKESAEALRRRGKAPV
jgi:hypothetical protein